jgi:Tol biopolymer transport system component
MKKSFLIIAFAFIIFAMAFSTQPNFSQTASAPKLFAEGVIETSADEYNPAFSPDGKTVYFTRRADRKGSETIMVSEWKNGKWSLPMAASFSGKFYDKEPFVSPDGKRIFFASTRPNGRDEKSNFDIWVVEKTKNGWSEARNLGANINSAGYDNYPSVAKDGTLYFASVRQDGRKDNDLYRSRFVNGEYQKSENLGDIINTRVTEADPFIAPDQSYLIFCSDREGGAGEGDLYVSFNERGAWTVPQSLGKNINTAEFEYTPLVSPDGKAFYFSRGWGEIFQIDFSALNFSALKQTAKEKADVAKVALNDYVGDYEIKPNLIFTVSSQNERLFGAAKGNKSELKMLSENQFADTKIDVKITFIKDADGKVTKLVLVENGIETSANKIK